MRPALLLIVLLASSCSAGPATFLRRPETLVGWPAADPEPRVEVLFVYHDPRDVKRRPGFWARLRNLIVGRPNSRMISPYGVSMTAEDELLVADTAQGLVHMLSLTTGRHATVDGGEKYPLVTPVGVASVPDGRFFVTDSTTGWVVAFSPSGTPQGAFGSPEELGRPTGIAYDPLRDRLLVVDTVGGRLLAYGLDGQLLAVSGERGGGPGQFNYPTNVAVDSDGTIFVMDSFNFRVQILSPDLDPLDQFGTIGSGPGTFAKPKGIALDADGHVYVVDGMFDNVQIFDRRGRLLLTFGASGGGFGGLSLPTGIMIDDQQRIFIADGGNARIQVFQYHGRPE